MKLLVLSNCPLDQTSGSGYVVLSFCHGLREQGHEVDLFGPEHYEPFKFLRRGVTYRKALGMFLCASRQLLQEKYDVVEFYGAESWLAVMMLSRLPRRSFLLVSHSNGLEAHSSKLLIQHLGSYSLDGSSPAWHQKLQGPFYEKAFTAVDGIVTVSDFDLDFAKERGYQHESRLLSIDNCLAEEYLNLPVSFQRDPIIGFCGSWLLRKGVSLIEPAMTKILEDFPQCSFKLIGVGDQFQPAERFPTHLLQRIQTIPFVADKDVLRRIYESLAIFIMPSIYESFGLVSAESMACGCALVSTKVGFAYSLVNREEVVIVEPNATSLYEAIKELLVDEQLRVRTARSGYERVQNLRWPQAVDRLALTYKQWQEERMAGRY